MAVLLDGKTVSNQILEELKNSVEILNRDNHKPPCITVFMVGNNQASKVYVNSIRKNCDKVGFNCYCEYLPEDTEENELIDRIKAANNNSDVNGILVQLPLPSQINSDNIASVISPDKDVDCFNPINFGKLWLGLPAPVPCTPQGAIELIKRYDINISGKNALVIGRSNIVGKPISFLLLKENATVTIAHSKTQNLQEMCKQADILVAAIGKHEFVKGDWVKDDAIVIDVGINSIPAPDTPKGFKLVGDVEFCEAEKHASFITPVPGGCGSMTIAMLLRNTLNNKLNSLKNN